MSPPPTGARRILHRLTHLGVDPALPRRETKHIVLMNGYALFGTMVFLISLAGAETNALRHDVRWALVLGIVGAACALALNAILHPILGAALLQLSNTCVFLYIGAREPAETEHTAVLISTVLVSFFLFPPRYRNLSALSTAAGVVGVVWMRFVLRDAPPTQLPGFDAYTIGTNNLIVVIALLAYFANRAAMEIERVETELIEEKKKTESILKREVAHQVAERSREMGSALAGVGPASPATGFGSRYRRVRALGEGGMGAVVEVERLSDGAHLALKVMTGDVSRDQAARFAREAEIGARIHHENLVSIMDIGVAENGAPFLVMELASGGSLEGQRAKFGDVPWALAILKQMARGLVALHEAGVVHRDLKPANVLLDGAGKAMLSDFGIARMGAIPMGAVDPDAPTASPARGSALTGTGAWIGTPLYMAPEAARGGREVGAAVDVFAFGLVAHEMLTGKLPFTTPPVLLALVGQPLPLVAPLEVAGLDAKARDAIAACLAEAPGARPSAKALQDALG